MMRSLTATIPAALTRFGTISFLTNIEAWICVIILYRSRQHSGLLSKFRGCIIISSKNSLPSVKSIRQIHPSGPWFRIGNRPTIPIHHAHLHQKKNRYKTILESGLRRMKYMCHRR
jgi:hypothetical protein